MTLENVVLKAREFIKDWDSSTLVSRTVWRSNPRAFFMNVRVIEEDEERFDKIITDSTQHVNINLIVDRVAKKITRALKANRMRPTTEDDWRAVAYLPAYVVDHPINPRIIFSPLCNTCEARFVIVKECMHLYAGLTYDREGKLADQTISDAIGAKFDTIMKFLTGRSTVLTDEQAAFLMAVEVLLPWTIRCNQIETIKQNARVTSASDCILLIARSFKIPAIGIVAPFFMPREDGKTYFALSSEINESIDRSRPFGSSI